MSDADTGEATLAEICIVALAEAFRGDGEVLCNPMGPVPVIAGRLARATFEPDLMLTDTIAYAIEGNLPLGGHGPRIRGRDRGDFAGRGQVPL